jgi:gamma-glutamylputrescine oxidase
VRCSSPVTHAWAANVSYTIKGEEPIHEQVRKGVFVIGAYSGTGNVIGAVFGKKAAKWVMKELISEKDTGTSLVNGV